jgi:hypothetical protein
MLVDYYNFGSPKAGSVFQVAAEANGVVYTKECCGGGSNSAAPAVRTSAVALVAAVAFGVLVSW